MIDPALVRAMEALLEPGPQAAACAPRLFGHWPGGKSFDEWFTADAVSTSGDHLEINFNAGEDILTVEHPGPWWPADNALVVADAQRVRLRTERTYPPQFRRPGGPPTFSRVMDYRTRPGAVTDHDGRRRRWSPPGAPHRPWHPGASRAPALELVLMWPLIHGTGSPGTAGG